MAHWSVGDVDLSLAQAQWTEFHVAADDVRECGARETHGKDGQDLRWAAHEDQESPGTDRLDAAELLEVPARRQWRPAEAAERPRGCFHGSKSVKNHAGRARGGSLTRASPHRIPRLDRS